MSACEMVCSAVLHIWQKQLRLTARVFTARDFPLKPFLSSLYPVLSYAVPQVIVVLKLFHSRGFSIVFMLNVAICVYAFVIGHP